MSTAATVEPAEHTVPTTPPLDFGSYPAEDVTWLLTDLTHVALEQGTEDREEAIQNGTHYSEMLPIEYQPDEAYMDLFHATLATTARRLAVAVGAVAEQVLARHGDRPVVLASLARAGTPIGVLLRRWLHTVHGIDAPHVTMSIIRGRGIDTVAIDWIRANHPGAAVQFVDGWTGKGAIQKQLTAAVGEYNATHGSDIDDTLAVLADPGHCTTLYGTRDDFLIPSACLNSTVSGLVSRTVLRDDLIGAGMFHGAKFYREFADRDVSRLFVDTVAEFFTAPDVVAQATAEAVRIGAEGAEPDWSGWRAVEEVARRNGITNINLAKPGVGETTRVLLRRVPWKVLARADRLDELTHVLALAEQRGVPVEIVDDIPYSCVGLIRQLNADSGPDAGAGSGEQQVLAALDLDRTLIFSSAMTRGVDEESMVIVEHYEGAPLSRMRDVAWELAGELMRTTEFVPVTTRTQAQYERVRLPGTPRFALVANGAVLLRDGLRDEEWLADTLALMSNAAPLEQVIAILAEVDQESWVKSVRSADDLFCYLVAHSRDQIPVDWTAATEQRVNDLGWTFSVQGRKVYAVPRGISKGAGLTRLRALLAEQGHEPLVLASGDSELDRSLMEAADLAIRPAHGELEDRGWSPEGLAVTTATGVEAGVEILEWMLAQ